MGHVPQPVVIEERLSKAASLPDVLDASFTSVLTQAAAQAGTQDDQAACQEAARAARRIRELITR